MYGSNPPPPGAGGLGEIFAPAIELATSKNQNGGWRKLEKQERQEQENDDNHKTEE